LSAGYKTVRYGEVPYLEAIATVDGGELTVFAVNRSLDEDMELELDISGFGKLELMEHIVLNCEDLKAVNTADKPDAVSPSTGNTARIIAELGKHSWNVLRYKIAER
jgi:alpha-N-arabinofuranosidase